jgi:hypothetical protein
MIDTSTNASKNRRGHGAQSSNDEDSVFSAASNDLHDPGRDSSNNVGTGQASIAVKESKAVRWIRVVASVVLVLAIVGVALLAVVFYYMTNTEKEAFVARFNSDSCKILESIGSTLDPSQMMPGWMRAWTLKKRL